MRSLETAILEVESAIKPEARSLPRLTVQYLEDVPAQAKNAIEAKLAELRAEIQAVQQRYGLPARPISQRRRLRARLSLVAVELAECTSSRMRGLAEVPGTERRLLDETMSRLENMVSELNQLLREDH